MNTRALLPLLPLLTGCIIIGPNDDAADDETSGDGDGDPSGDGDGAPGDGDGAPGDGDGDGAPGDGDGAPGDGDGAPEQWCGLDEGPDEPWFTLSQFGEPLEAGGSLAVECGFQGFFMIEINPDLGGFIPDAASVNFQVTLDVEGFNVGPDGHFAVGDFDIFVDCCDPYSYDCYYLVTTFQMFPPDAIADLAAIHEAPATLEVTMSTPQGPVSQVLDVSMWAMEQDMEWQYCSYEYYPVVEQLPLAGSIPE